MAAPDAQYGEKQVGGPVEHSGVVGKIGSGGDKAQYTHQLHPLQAAGCLTEHGQEVQGRETGGVIALLHRQVHAHPAGVAQHALHQRALAGQRDPFPGLPPGAVASFGLGRLGKRQSQLLQPRLRTHASVPLALM